jgi:hypothetical protein
LLHSISPCHRICGPKTILSNFICNTNTKISKDSAVHFAIGSWYQSDELARRGGIFHAALSLGTLTSGLLQAAASKSLSGVDGLAGWRWNFIITSIFPLTLGPIGYFIWPGTPDKPNRRVISEADLTLAKLRLEKSGAQVHPLPFSVPLLKKLFSHKKVYILTALLILGFNSAPGNGSFLLWLKSLHRYSTPTLNNISTLQPAIGILFVLIFIVLADLGPGKTFSFLLASTLNFISLVILAIWTVPEDAKWFAFSLGALTNSLTPIVYSWANSLMRHDIDERAITLIIMQVFSTSTNAWVPLLVWPTVQAPRFRRGWLFAAVMTVTGAVVGVLTGYIHRKELYAVLTFD